MHRQIPANSLAAVLDKDTEELMEYQHPIANPKYHATWTAAYGKELGRLAQGLTGTITGTNTVDFINKADIPAERWFDITYGRIVANFLPQKMTLTTFVSLSVVTASTFPATAALPQPTWLPPNYYAKVLSPHLGHAS